jgi:hypothetical protein
MTKYVTFPEMYILVIGGETANSGVSNEVELISLDLKNNPVPARFRNLNTLPLKVNRGGGALFTAGNIQIMKFASHVKQGRY